LYLGEALESVLYTIKVSIDGVEIMIRWVAEWWARESS
jgi:hypothetical protein